MAIAKLHRVFPRESFRSDVDAFVRRLADGPPLAYRHMKRHINLVESGAQLPDLLDLEAEAMARTAGSHDFKAASKAFLEKTKPRFEGR